MATGTLSSIKQPDFEGLDKFDGDWYVTGKWPHEGVDFSEKKVGIIGTGSSAVQSIPVIAKYAKHLTVFQRSPNYSIPANNRPLSKKEIPPPCQVSPASSNRFFPGFSALSFFIMVATYAMPPILPSILALLI